MSASSLGQLPYRPAWVSPVISWEDCDERRRAKLRAAWRDGEISHQLTPSQRDSYDKLRTWETTRHYTERGREYVLDISRRWGKSVVGLVWLVENCQRRPRSRHLYIGPLRNQIEKIQLPLMAHILSECPPELRPKWNVTQRSYTFPNGSVIELEGLDKNPNGSRGGAIDGAFLDECGFFNRLMYLLGSVLMQQLLGRTWGNLLLASTPPETPAHPWSTEIVKKAIARCGYDKKTLYDADQYPNEEIEFFIREAGGRGNPKCEREYFAKHIADPEKVCIPEYVDVAEEIVREVEPPAWRHCYTTMDPGWHDMLAVLFGYWHFEKAQLVIEDEICEAKMNSNKLAALLKAKEAELWTGVPCSHSNGVLSAQPFRRYSDRDPRLIGDLKEIHGLSFRQALKDTPIQAVNDLRGAIEKRLILIHPRCVKLQAHLESAVWKNDAYKAFAWNGGIFGHFDLVSALLYMWRNVKQTRNPVPKQAVHLGPNQHMSAPPAPERKASPWTRERQPSGWSKQAPEPRAKWAREGGRIVRVR